MNPKKCTAIIAMRSSILVKEVQQSTGRMAALSRFVSTRGDKGHPYFQCLKRNNRMDPGVRRGVCETEGVPGQSTSFVHAGARYSASPILRSYREDD